MRDYARWEMGRRAGRVCRLRARRTKLNGQLSQFGIHFGNDETGPASARITHWRFTRLAGLPAEDARESGT
jgi:hypothetical protein